VLGDFSSWVKRAVRDTEYLCLMPKLRIIEGIHDCRIFPKIASALQERRFEDTENV
jgi:hypothetical protein